MAAMGDVVERSKSPSDKKQYRLLTLPNALQVLLISMIDVPRTGPADEEDGENEDVDDDDDDDEDDDDMSGSEQSGFDGDDDGHGPPRRRAGACLTVGIGSFAEPEELPGLAHYLEHMLFMGSEKYPDENEFESFLSAHGGFSNGQTDNEMTSYTFEVGPAHLEKALDMFAHFFISPLMKADALERELSAIESEFSQATQNDQVRLQQVLCDTAPSAHPYSRFGWGNELSLKVQAEQAGIDVRSEIRAFYDRFYSANLMKLVVCGDDSLDELEKWVTSSFSSIPNRNVTRPEFSSAGFPFGEGVDPSPVLCRVVPVRDIHTLHLEWMIPPVFGHHHQKPADYIASLIGHESEGSLLSYLKRLGWISSITAGVTDSDGFDAGTFGAKFDVTMKLTLSGIDHWESIIEALFEYIAMLQSSGLPEWVFEELQALADISFRFQEDNSAVEQCEELAQIMQDMFKVEPESLLTYNLYRGSFHRDAVASVLTCLRPTNVRVLLVSQSHTTKDLAFEEKAVQEKWFGVQYASEFISEKTLVAWKNVKHTHQDLRLPDPNPFIPRNFELVREPKYNGDVQAQVHPFGKLWFKPDRDFKTPRASLAFLIQLPAVTKSAQAHVLTELFVKLVRDALNEYAYHASVAELMYSLRVKDGGLELLFGGFSDKLHLLVQLVSTKLFAPVFDSKRYEHIKQDMLREYKNALIKPAHKAKYLRLQLLEQHSFRREESVAAIETATLEQLTVFVSDTLWKSSAYLASFAHGNLSPVMASDLQKVMEEGLERVGSSPMSTISSSEWPTRHIHCLPIVPSGLLLQANSEHAEDKNTVVEYYYQFGEHDIRMLAYADLLHQLMEEPLFDTLRTKQELGYDVSCTVRVTHGVIGFGITVQSSLFKSSYIRACIDRFLVEFEHAIASMSNEHFQDHIQAQILKKLEPDHSLLEMTQRYWYEISSGRLIFDINERLASELEHCTKQELLAYYREAILRSPRKLVVQIVGQASPDVTGDKKHRAAQPRRTSQRKSKHSSVTSEPTLVEDVYVLKGGLACFPDRFQLQRDCDKSIQTDTNSINL